mmetsp:Transcript_83462/g.232829  ORF Transcript_83462/g.232829 Transcript_83462/m.232829 type:complete len:293 (-) Transcript_83462:125-1003(-)
MQSCPPNCSSNTSVLLSPRAMQMKRWSSSIVTSLTSCGILQCTNGGGEGLRGTATPTPSVISPSLMPQIETVSSPPANNHPSVPCAIVKQLIGLPLGHLSRTNSSPEMFQRCTPSCVFVAIATPTSMEPGQCLVFNTGRSCSRTTACSMAYVASCSCQKAFIILTRWPLAVATSQDPSVCGLFLMLASVMVVSGKGSCLVSFAPKVRSASSIFQKTILSSVAPITGPCAPAMDTEIIFPAPGYKTDIRRKHAIRSEANFQTRTVPSLPAVTMYSPDKLASKSRQAPSCPRDE